MVTPREDVPKEYVWNVQEMYSDLTTWEKAYQICDEGRVWPEVEKYQANIHSPNSLKELLDLYFASNRELEKLYVYAHLRHDEDLKNPKYKSAFAKIKGLYMDFQKDTSWINPTLLSLSEEQFQVLLDSEALSQYKVLLEKMNRMKKHTLTEKEEALLALAAKPLSSIQTSYSAINNADLQFKKVTDKEGKEHELSHGLLSQYLRSEDRVLRKSAYENFLREYAAYENTITEILQGKIAADVFQAKARNYSDSLESALYRNDIDVAVYHNLIETVRENKEVMHKYVSLRKKLLGVDELYSYDLYVPLVSCDEFHMNYETAKKTVVDSVAFLGSSYQKTLEQGLYKHGWVDVMENQNKRSGAYSSGCYDSHPYILLNYTGNINDVFTLAHEAGHSMHSDYSRKNQPYVYADYPIFVAEVASTFNEQLLLNSLLKKAKSSKEKAYLLCYAIDAIRGTLYRQTLFAEFELKLHKWAEKGIPLTPQFLRKEYRKLKQEYYGPDLTLDEYIEVEYLRIPHFYYNFYVYQYATGISAALALVEKTSADPKAIEDYLTFLSSGGSKFPLELLETAGVDMRKKEPISAAFRHLSNLIDELETLLESENPAESLQENV